MAKPAGSILTICLPAPTWSLLPAIEARSSNQGCRRASEPRQLTRRGTSAAAIICFAHRSIGQFDAPLEAPRITSARAASSAARGLENASDECCFSIIGANTDVPVAVLRWSPLGTLVGQNRHAVYGSEPCTSRGAFQQLGWATIAVMATFDGIPVDLAALIDMRMCPGHSTRDGNRAGERDDREKARRPQQP